MTTLSEPTFRPTTAAASLLHEALARSHQRCDGLTGSGADVDEVSEGRRRDVRCPDGGLPACVAAGADCRERSRTALRHDGSSTTFPPAWPSRTNRRASAASASG